MGLLSQFREKRRRRKLSRLTPQAIFNEYFHKSRNCKMGQKDHMRPNR